MTRLSGIISFQFDDFQSDTQTALGLVAVSLVLATEELEEATADGYGWRTHFAGRQSWRASSIANEILDANLNREVAQQELETLHFTRTIFPVIFTSIAGTEYSGYAWISALRLPSADQQAVRAEVSFSGVGELIQTPPPT